MKLKLSQQQDVSVLDILEEVSPENVAVLRAGVTKLLQSGKNKIVLNLIAAKHLSPQIVQEVVKLHLVATELQGDVVLVGHGDLVKQAIQLFSDPPAVKYFSMLDAAVKSFLEERTVQIASAPKLVIDPNDPNGELKARVAQLEQENTTLKGKLKNMNVDEVKRLRYENGMFQQQLAVMEDQLKNLTKERKKPFEMESMSVKITQLETALEDFLNKDGMLEKAKPKQ